MEVGRARFIAATYILSQVVVKITKFIWCECRPWYLGLMCWIARKGNRNCIERQINCEPVINWKRWT